MANETITGKIFTLKDPTGTYNRFPRTVMEAVYGLIPYLQNQFGALADIYMPIEGITESKPLQEFVYRLCPSSIKAKSVSLDRIYGKTLAWNQSAKEISSSNWHGLGSTTATFSNGVASFTAVAQYGGVSQNDTLLNVVAGHYYYTCYESISTMSYGKGRLSDSADSADSAISCPISGPSTSFIKNANVKQASSSGQRSPTFWDVRTSDWDEVKIRNVQVVDLTLLYGSAIDGLTTDQMKAKFESEFPGYHDYSAGKLISNDAESIETVGFNQMNEDLDKFDSTHLVTKYIEVLPNTDYYLKYPTNMGAGIVWYYDANKNTIKTDNPALNNHVFTTPAGTRYIRLLFQEAYGTTYLHDTCINLSDPAKNGTYEPYRKSVMQLGLAEFQVRDSQGNVTTITGGLKSAGSVKDEIVGNKYIKRVGSVDLGTLNWGNIEKINGKFVAFLSGRKNYGAAITTKGYTVYQGSSIDPVNLPDKTLVFNNYYFDGGINIIDSAYTDSASFKAAMSGVKLYYELATPIEYELVSPLVPTVKAGETEARISPNSDGLSAPMVADMTYDANANNDSASAQYALTAGRLLNSHKLWGQDFDGTQDVAGALTGVTSLNSLLYLGSTNVGIGQSNPQYKLDVSGTARFTGAATLGSTLSVAGNTTVGGTLGVTGATTLTGALTANGAVSINNTLTVGTSQTNRATTLNGTLSVTGLTSIAGGLKLTTTKKIWFDDTHYLELLTENGTQYLHTNLNVVSDAGVVAGASANS